MELPTESAINSTNLTTADFPLTALIAGNAGLSCDHSNYYFLSGQTKQSRGIIILHLLTSGVQQAYLLFQLLDPPIPFLQ